MLLAAPLLLLASCGGDDDGDDGLPDAGGSVDAPADPDGAVAMPPDAGDDGDASPLDPDAGRTGEAPAVALAFPPSTGVVATNTLVMRGTAVDEDGVRAIRVNGMEATLELLPGGSVAWSLAVSLQPGSNDLIIQSEDEQGHIDPAAARASIDYTGGVLRAPRGMTLDPSRGRGLFVDRELPALLAIDPATGLLTVIADRHTGTGPALEIPRDVILDVQNDRALIVDGDDGDGLLALVAVDLETGDRTIVARIFGDPNSVAVDTASNRALMGYVRDYETTDDPCGLLAVDLGTGEVTNVSGPSFGSGPLPGCAFSSLVLDAQSPAGPRILSLSGSAVLAVDPATGDRSMVFDVGTSGVGSVSSFDLDTASNRLLLAASTGLYAVDLGSGALTMISEGDTGGGHVALDVAAGQALIASPAQQMIMRIDLDTGARTILSRQFPGSGPRLQSPAAVALAPSGQHVLVTDVGQSALLTIDMATGERSVLSSSNVGGGPALQSGFSLDVDASANQAFIISGQSLIAVDLATGDRTTISSANRGSGLAFQCPRELVVNPENDTLVVADPCTWPLFRVDPATGNRTAMPTDRADIYADALALDREGERLLALDIGMEPELLAVDLASGDITILADAQTGSGPMFEDPEAMALDAKRGRALIYDGDLDILLAVDLATSERTIVSGATRGIPLHEARFLSMDPERDVVLTVDNALDAFVVIDLHTGQRVVASR